MDIVQSNYFNPIPLLSVLQNLNPPYKYRPYIHLLLLCFVVHPLSHLCEHGFGAIRQSPVSLPLYMQLKFNGSSFL